MAKYRKKPVVIEAIQWSGSNWHQMLEFAEWGEGEENNDAHVEGNKLFIRTLEGTMEASPGDWVIQGVQGEFYPCKPDIFEATYELVDD